MNEIIFLCILIIGILTIYLSNKLLGTLGLKIIFISFSLISFLLTFKHITISTLNINSNITAYSVLFTSICLLIEQGKIKEIKKLNLLNLILISFSSIILYIMANYTQSVNDTIGINMTNVFTSTNENYKYAILIYYPISIFISTKLLLYIYIKIKKIYENIFISMVTSYLAVGIINTLIYYIIVYFQVLKINTIIKIVLSSYMINIIIIVIYSIILTLLEQKKVKK